MGLFDGLLGGGSGSDLYSDLYGDLLTPKMKEALQTRAMLASAGALADAAMPTRVPMPWGAALGKAAAALGSGQDAAGQDILKQMGLVQNIRAAKQKQGMLDKLSTYNQQMMEEARRRRLASTMPQGLPSTMPQTPGAVPAPAVPSHAPPPPPSAAAAPAAPGGGMSTYDYESGAPSGGPPAAPAKAADAGLAPGEYAATNRIGERQIYNPQTGWRDASVDNRDLLALASGAPDTVLPSGGDGYGVLPMMAASYGGQQGGGLPFRRAAADPGAAGGDILDTVEQYESGGRNVHQGVVSPKVSTAQGYYQITNSTWRDTAPKAGVSLADYPTAMTAPKEVQRAVAEQLYSERGLQPWADFNPALARATGYSKGGGGDVAARWQAASDRGEQPADALLPSGEERSALQSLMALASGPGGGLGGADELVMPFPTVAGGPNSGTGKPQWTYEPSSKPYDPSVDRPDNATVGPEEARMNAGATNVDTVIPAPGRSSMPRIMQAQASGAPGGAPGGGPPGALPLAAPRGLPLPRLPSAPPGAGVIPSLGVSPDELASFDALAELAGLGSPMKGYLENYYKSPGYLGEAADAQTRARLNLELPAEIYKQKNQAALTMQTKMAEEGMTLDAAGNVVPIENWRDIKGMNESKLAEARETWKARLTPVDALVWGPDGRQYKEQMTQYEFTLRREAVAKRNAALARAGAPVTPQPGDIAGAPVITEMEKGVGNKLVDAHMQSFDAAKSAVRSIQNTHDLRRSLDSGMFTGLTGDWQLFAAKFSDALGFASPDTKDKIKNTELYAAQLGQETANIIKQAKLGPPTSDSDVKFAMEIAGGRNLSADSIRKLLDLREKYSRIVIKEHNEEARGIDQRAFGGLSTVIPEDRIPAPYEGAPPAGGAPAGGAPRERRWNPKTKTLE